MFSIAPLQCIDHLRCLWSLNCACALSTFNAATMALGPCANKTYAIESERQVKCQLCSTEVALLMVQNVVIVRTTKLDFDWYYSRCKPLASLGDSPAKMNGSVLGKTMRKIPRSSTSSTS